MHIACTAPATTACRQEGSLFWTVCTDTIGQVPEMAPPKEGWQPGQYEIYPVTRYRSRRTRATTSRSRSSIRTTPRRGARRSAAIKLDHKLDTPMLVEVPVRADRQQRREGLSGDRCSKAAFAFEPDVVAPIARPIPGLMCARCRRSRRSRCASSTRMTRRSRRARTSARPDGPSWQPEIEIHFGQRRGRPSTASRRPAAAAPTEDKVTLMIFDSSTQFDPLAAAALPGPLDLAHRALALSLPAARPRRDRSQVARARRADPRSCSRAAPADCSSIPISTSTATSRARRGMGEPGTSRRRTSRCSSSPPVTTCASLAADGLDSTSRPPTSRSRRGAPHRSPRRARSTKKLEPRRPRAARSPTRSSRRIDAIEAAAMPASTACRAVRPPGPDRLRRQRGDPRRRRAHPQHPRRRGPRDHPCLRLARGLRQAARGVRASSSRRSRRAARPCS